MLQRSILVELTTERDALVLLKDSEIQRASGPGGPPGRTWVAEDPYEKSAALRPNDAPKV
jgi:hypothetical protein